MTNLFYFPLSKQEILDLQKGKLVSKNYSEIPHDKLLCVVAWNRSKMLELKKRKFDAMRKAGIDVANIPLWESQLSKIYHGDGISVHFEGFEILVLLEETLAKLRSERGS